MGKVGVCDLEFLKSVNGNMVATFAKPDDYFDGESEFAVNDTVAAAQEQGSFFENYELDLLETENFEDCIIFTLDEDEYNEFNRYRIFYKLKH